MRRHCGFGLLQRAVRHGQPAATAARQWPVPVGPLGTRLGLLRPAGAQAPLLEARHYSSARAPLDSSAAAAWRRRALPLQRAFNADPGNPQRLSDLLRVLNHFDPQQAVRIFEQQDPAIAAANRDAVREYIRALVLSNRLDMTDLDYMLGRHRHAPTGAPAAAAASPGVAAQAATATGSGGSAASAAGAAQIALAGSEPLQVQVVDSNRAAMWRLLRSGIMMLIVVAGVSVVAEGLVGTMQKRAEGFGMNSKKVVPVEEVHTTFDDVRGCDEVKEELQEIIMYLKDPDKFTRLGAKLPKGMMMSGPPGTGKTLLARAIAGEAGVPFLQTSGSEFEEMFVGVGARRIRDLFAEARKHSPCIIFIDEIDAVGSKRSNRDNSSVRATLNQLLVELDGFEENNGIVVICATNFVASLDLALMRPGRLDKHVVVPIPDLKGRTEILEMYAAKLKLDPTVELTTLARRTAGMTGADLFNILNIAAVRSSAENLASVSAKYIEEAFDRVVVGLERRNPMSDFEKKLTAYHEGGHALVALKSTGADPVHKATIMPRGNALGVTWSIPEKEKYSERLFELQAHLEVAMGGKAAEELIFGADNVSAGCTSDLQGATQLARRMVMNFGMAGESGAPMYLNVDEYAILSEEAKREIDQKTQRLLTEAYQKAACYLRTHEQELHRLAEALVEYETLSAEEIGLAIKGQGTRIGAQRATSLDSARQEPKKPGGGAREARSESSDKAAEAGESGAEA